jgi:hypothetical protein
MSVVDSKGAEQPRVVLSTAVVGRPCVACSQAPVTLFASPAKCAAINSTSIAARLLHSGRAPRDGVQLSFAPGTPLEPGTRGMTVTAVTPVSKVTASCSAPAVTVRDSTAPIVKPRAPRGVCASPMSWRSTAPRWACWRLAELVTVTDNCEDAAPMAFMVKCASGGAAAAALPAADCAALPDGRVCVRAGGGGGAAKSLAGGFVVNVKDGYGNVAHPVTVAVTVHTRATRGCHAATLVDLGGNAG